MVYQWFINCVSMVISLEIAIGSSMDINGYIRGSMDIVHGCSLRFRINVIFGYVMFENWIHPRARVLAISWKK
jgi:hypothetical protein